VTCVAALFRTVFLPFLGLLTCKIWQVEHFWSCVMKLFVSYMEEYVLIFFVFSVGIKLQSDTKKRELLKNPTKIEEIQEKKFIDRN
jgi:uncharacterized membrane protein YbjE (DUF340 family)